jgi:glycosyltransferase involved in cell wall biosynthesis
MPEKVLFIGHAASRSGAPILLLQLMQWLRANSDLSFDAMVLSDGPLMPDMQRVAPTRAIETWPSLPSRAARKLIGAARWSARLDRQFQRDAVKSGYALGYVNTVVPVRQAVLLAQQGIPVVCHVHELDFAVMYLIGEADMTRLISAVTHFIAASQAVGDYLTTRWKIPQSKISVIHEFTLAPVVAAAEHSNNRQRTRAELGVDDSEILVGSCGTLDWRKGADLFLQIVRLIGARGRAPAIKFVWIGAQPAQPETQRFQHDLRVSGLSSIVRVVEVTAEPQRYYAAMDIFALTSREDPFPLVMLEAAAAGLPVVCFNDSGGGPEFVENDAGVIAPYLDVETFAAHVFELAASPERRRQLGEAGRAKVAERYTITLQAPKLLDVISRFARNG